MLYANIKDIETLWRPLTESEAQRAVALLPVVCGMIDVAGENAGKCIPLMEMNNSGYAEVLKLVTVDVVSRILRQETSGEPMKQISQSAIGYNFQGTYAIPGGGMANALLNNDLKRLGLRRQRMGVVEYAHGDHHTACEPGKNW